MRYKCLILFVLLAFSACEDHLPDAPAQDVSDASADLLGGDDVAGALDLEEDLVADVVAELPPGPSCGGPPAFPRICGAVEEAPADVDGWGAQLRGQARALECEGEPYVEPLVELSQGARVFLYGEVHGAAQIRALGLALVERLREEGFATVALEVNMDYDEHYETFRQSGGGPLVTDLLHFQLSPLELHRVYADLARALFLRGEELIVVGVDMPVFPDWARAKLLELSELVPDAALLTEGLPPEHRRFGAPPEESKVMAWDYLQRLQGDDPRWEGAPEGLRDRALRLARGQWLNFVMWDLDFAPLQTQARFQEEREALMTANARAHLARGPLFLHMGMGHTSKATCDYFPSDFLARRLGEAEGISVRSVGTLFGGGAISYGGQLVPLEPDYPELAAQLDPLEADALLLPTWPDEGCARSHLGQRYHSNVGNLLEPAYDALLYFKELSPLP